MTRTSLLLSRRIPDPSRLAVATENPGQGPRILFFTGGTALRETSQSLIQYTHNSIHLVTPFDSGGSSAVLRQAFAMPAVGDLRNRLMALADRSLYGYPEIYDLFAHRLPRLASPASLASELAVLAQGNHPLLTRISAPMYEIIHHHLHLFAAVAGSDFDLRGASVGNLILTAGYLENKRHMEPIVATYSNLVQVRGDVRLLVNADVQLQALLENGKCITGQHLLTGKEGDPIDAPVTDLSLVTSGATHRAVSLEIPEKNKAAIRGADLICYPFGSFYSSLIANLLPNGVGQSISQASCPKVFVPSTLHDPECLGLSLPDQVHTLLRYVHTESMRSPGDVLNFVLLDPRLPYVNAENIETEMAALGISVLETPLINTHTGGIDPQLLCQALVSLA